MSGYQVGDVINGEFLVHEIFGGEGRSGMGVVYLVTSSDNEVPFVLKTFQQSGQARTKLAGFVKEAEAWVNIGNHANIVQAYWVSEFSNQLFVAAEFIAPDSEGRNTISDYCRQSPVKESMVIKWGCQFCYGMRHALRNGVLAHRDIKPANLMVDFSMNLRITDFGLVKFVGGEYPSGHDKLGFEHLGTSRTMTGAAFGTLPYMAPEQFVDAKTVDHRADIYSLGIVLFQLLSGGILPFVPDRNTKDAVSEYYKLHAFTKPPELKSVLFPLIHKCLEKKREDRFRTYDELIEAFRSVAMEADIHIPDETISLDSEIEKYFVQAQSYAALGKPNEALNSIDVYISKNPRSSSAWLEKGKILLENFSKVDESIQSTQKAIDIDPLNSHAWNNLGLAYKRSGKLSGAIDAYNKGLDCDPYNTGCMMNLAVALVEDNKPKNAVAVLSLAVEVNPKKATLWLNLGSAYKYLGEYQKALDAFIRAIEVNDRLTEGWISLSYIHEENGDTQEALGVVEQGSNQNPDDWQIRLRRSTLLEKLGRHDDAIKVFTETERLLLELAKKFPCESKYWHNLGLVYLTKKEADKAIECFSKVEKIDPNDSFAIWTLATLFYEKHRAEETISYCNKLFRFPKYVLKALSMEVNVLTFLGMYSQAVNEVSDFLRTNPNCDSAWFLLAHVHEYNGEFAKAMHCLQRCREILNEAEKPNLDNVQDVQQKLIELESKLENK